MCVVGGGRMGRHSDWGGGRRGREVGRDNEGAEKDREGELGADEVKGKWRTREGWAEGGTDEARRVRFLEMGLREAGIEVGEREEAVGN